MKIDTAKRLLAPLATVVRRGRQYRATLTDTGAVITFRDSNGWVADVRLARRGHGTWACGLMKRAIEHGLARRGRTISDGRHALGVCVARRGRAFEPMASFLLMDFTHGVANMTGAEREWPDREAIAVVESIIAGTVAMPEALEWLTGRGVVVT